MFRGRVWMVRRHSLLIALLTAAIAVRVLTIISFPPALFFGDSWGYVVTAFSGHALGFVPVAISAVRPSGYPFLLWLFSLPGRNFLPLVVFQHLAGLLTGLLVYGALVRAGLHRLAAALAAALVLLDGYLITLEQYLMPDVLFSLTLLVSMLLLSWRVLPRGVSGEGISGEGPPATRLAGGPRHPALNPVLPAISGFLLAAGILQRTAGMFAIPAFVAYLLVTRVGWRALTGFALALLIPLLAYASAEHSRYGTFGLTRTSGWILYGRVGGFANCNGLQLPSTTRPLCESASARRGHPDAPTWYVFSPASPADRLFGGNVETAPARANGQLGAFGRKIMLHQPLDYVGTAGEDLLRFFTPGASTFGQASSATSLPRHASDELIVEGVRRRYLPAVHPHVQAPASVVREYRSVVHVPRPVLALLALLSLAALVLRITMWKEVLLLSGGALLMLIGIAGTAGFGLRYLLPSVPPLAIGGSLACYELSRLGSRALSARSRWRA